MGIWLEVVTLLIPDFNDSDAEIAQLTGFLAGVSPDIPWHVTAFQSDYRMSDTANTTARALVRAAAIGRRSGLRYIYAGNLPGQVKDLEDTRCPECGTTVVERRGYSIQSYHLAAGGHCPSCGLKIPGRWDRCFAGQRTTGPFIPGRPGSIEGRTWADL